MTERLQAIVGARISDFKKKMAQVQKIARGIPNKIAVQVVARTEKAQNKLNKIAQTMMSLQVVSSNFALGSLVSISPAAIPILATLVGLLGSLGPMLGVIGGSTFALATAFGFAGTAAVAFGALAIPTISALFDETKKLTRAQKGAKKTFDDLKSTWNGISKELEPRVLEAFSRSMIIANEILEKSKPLFKSSADAVNNLLASLKQSLGTPAVQKFFDYMNKSAGPMLETLGKAFGNFTQGFMSMMVAFGPLAEETAKGFLKMSQGFAKWASGLSENTKFQTFVKYIQENMPKIKSIFGDAIVGMINTFAAFGPLASDMMTGLQNMMSRFKEWSATLGENQQFQQFIGYIRENAPKVITLIGNLTNFLINLGIGLAPLGQQILDLVNGFLSWTNTLMESNPAIAKFIGYGIVIGGILRGLTPLILTASSFFSGFGKTLVKVFTSVIQYFLPFKGSLMMGLKMLGTSALNLGKKFFSTALRIASGWVVAMGPVGWVIAIVVGLVALIIANWDKVKEWTLKIWNALPQDVRSSLSKIANFVKQYFTMVWKNIVSIFEFIKGTFKNALKFLVSLVKGDFQGMKDAASDQMNLMKETVSNIIDNIVNFFKSVNLYDSGKAIIQSAIDGLVSMKDKILGKVEDIVGAVRDYWPFSPAKVGPLSDIHKMDFKGPIITSINKARSGIANAMSNLATVARDSFQPQTSFAFDTGLTTSDFGRIRHDVGAEVSSFEMPQPIINVYNEWDGEQVRTYVERGNARNSRLTDGFSGK